jgi:hypothetical protein
LTFDEWIEDVVATAAHDKHTAPPLSESMVLLVLLVVKILVSGTGKERLEVMTPRCEV